MMKLSMLGAPGCGKGTQAKKLSAYYNIPHISTGDIFRKAIKEQTELGKLAEKYMSKLVPDEITIGLVKERVKEADCANGFILDGFPRTVAQAEAFLKDNSFDRILYFNIDEQTVIKRILARRTCANCGEIYIDDGNLGKICTKCGGDLIVRAEDSKIEERINTYNKETFPLVNYFKEKGLIFEINTNDVKSTEASAQIEEIFNIITKELDANK